MVAWNMGYWNARWKLEYFTLKYCNYIVKYGLQVTFYLPKYCKKVPIYCIKIQVKSWFVAINTSTEK